MKREKFSIAQFFLLWLISPLIGAFFLFRELKGTSNMAPYLLLSLFFGLSFVIAPSSGADCVRYAKELAYLHESDAPFSTYVLNIYSEENTKVDIYQPVLTWVVSKFTGNFRVLFGIYALVFGYFWFKSIYLARSLLPDRLSGFLWLILVFFALINPIWSINGVRMWTAVGMFFYGLLLLHFLNSRKGYVFIVIPLFVHFSLAFALILYLLYRLLPFKSVSVLFIIYVLTFFIGQLDPVFIRNNFELLPGIIQTRRSYVNEEYVSGYFLDVQNSVHIILYKNLLRYLITSMVSFIFFYMYFRKTPSHSQFTQFFELTLVFSIFSNLVGEIPSGSRFVILSNLIIVFCFIWYLSSQIKGYVQKFYQNLMFICLIFLIIVQFRIGSDYFGIFLFVGNPVGNLLIQDTTPFIDYIKNLL